MAIEKIGIKAAYDSKKKRRNSKKVFFYKL